MSTGTAPRSSDLSFPWWRSPSLLPQRMREFLQAWLAGSRGETLEWGKPLLLLVTLFAVLRPAYFSLCKLPEALYFGPSIVLSSLLHVPSLLWWLVTAVWIWTRRNCLWSDVTPTATLRVFVMFLVGVLTWTFSVYDYNLYYDQWHGWDRALLVALGAAVWFRPAALAPWLMLVYLITHQFDYPLSCTWTDKRAMFDVLTLCQTFLVLSTWLSGRGTGNVQRDQAGAAVDNLPVGILFCGIFCLQAANYFYPGVGKAVLGWHFVERLDNLFIASWLNGWWGFLSEAEALGWAAWIARWNWFLVWSSLLLELAVIFVFWQRWVSVALWIGCMGLHVLICVTTGILFWKWILLDLAFIGVLLLHPRQELETWFRWPARKVSMLAILLAPIFFQPIWLAWYDTELNDYYHLQAVTTDGKVYVVPRTWMTPQEVYFAQNKFHYLVPDEQFVVGRYGTTPSWEVSQRLDGCPTAETAAAVCRELGDKEFSERKAAAFDHFIVRYFSGWNQRHQRHLIPTWLQPPQHIYSWSPGPALPDHADVAEIRVVHLRTLYQRDRLLPLQDRIIRRIPIPAAG